MQVYCPNLHPEFVPKPKRVEVVYHAYGPFDFKMKTATVVVYSPFKNARSLTKKNDRESHIQPENHSVVVYESVELPSLTGLRGNNKTAAVKEKDPLHQVFRKTPPMVTVKKQDPFRYLVFTKATRWLI
jgi:hypothetical protein